MAIQNRRGAYGDFDPSKMVPGEFAVVQSNDPSATDGKSVYLAFAAGDVKRLATHDDLVAEITDVTEDIIEEVSTGIEAAIHDDMETASAAANTATQKAADATLASAANLAAAYSTSATYAVGDYCNKDGTLYRCTTAITTAESWTAAHWTAVKVGNEIGDLNSAIDDIATTIVSENIFNQADATVVEGKYLNYATGNEGTNATYSYCADYIPVKPNTQYFGGIWRKETGLYFGAYDGFIVFYDENKGYLSGRNSDGTLNPFTTPSGCAFMRLSFPLAGWSKNNYMFVKSSTAPQTYVPYWKKTVLKLPMHIVDLNGNGEYTSIASAVNELDDGSIILVMPGIYSENVKAWTKEIHIIGIDREACILKDTSGNYTTPPLEIGAGSIQNMSIIEDSNGVGSENMGAYAVHVESNNLYNKKLLIRNCYIYSDSSSAIGMGLRGGCSVRIEDCEIICAGARVSTGAAPLYFHDADAQAYWGVANLYLHNNVLRNTASTLFSMLTINSIHKENTTYMHMMYNIFVRSKTPAIQQKYNTWNSSGNSDADGWNGLSHMYLEDDSYGNNQADLNYSA